jgi:RNA polymerase sigma-70 factor (ECF subfamily)
MTGYRPEAEDAVHDTFVTALARLRELRDPEAAAGWLQTILRNTCRMTLRRRRRHASPEETELCFRELREEALVEGLIEGRELRDRVWTALAQLPEPLRATVLLRYFSGYDSYRELAAILSVPVGTVRSRLFDAKARLSSLLTENAGRGDGSQQRLAAQRWALYSEAFRSLYRGGRDTFLAHFADDLRFVQDGQETLGRRHLDAGIDDDLRAGVSVRPVRVLASGSLTVLEGTLLNPPDDPLHCPPGVVLVMYEDERQVRRLHLHLAPRPPAPELTPGPALKVSGQEGGISASGDGRGKRAQRAAAHH